MSTFFLSIVPSFYIHRSCLPKYAYFLPFIFKTITFADVYGGIPIKETFCCDIKILKNIGFTVGYSDFYKNPVWVGHSTHNEGSSAYQH